MVPAFFMHIKYKKSIKTLKKIRGGYNCNINKFGLLPKNITSKVFFVQKGGLNVTDLRDYKI